MHAGKEQAMEQGLLHFKMIAVTAEDIRDGEPENASSCPVALALTRAFPGFEPEADKLHIGLRDYETDTEYSADTPDSAAEFIERFDDGEPVEPFEFKLEYREVTY